MTLDLVLRLGALAALVASAAISGYYRTRAAREGGALPPPPADQPTVQARAAFGILLLGLLVQAVAAPRSAPWLMVDLALTVRIVGLGVAVLAVPLVWWIFRSIGTSVSESSATRQGATLVTHGPYRWVRHPLYSAVTAALAGVAVALRSLGMILLLGAVLLWLPGRVRNEERHLVASYGDRYRNYARRTGRFIPRLLSRRR